MNFGHNKFFTESWLGMLGACNEILLHIDFSAIV